MVNLTGTAGDDVLTGGAEDDYIEDRYGGADVLSGGGGNDSLYVFRGTNSMATNIRMNGDAGDDSITFGTGYDTASHFIIDAGSGNDHLELGGFHVGSAIITLGEGSDVVRLNVGHLAAGNPTFHVTFTDFQAGAGGDVIQWYENLAYTLANWNGANPFSTGHMRLVQSGSDTLLQRDKDGSGAEHSYVTTFTFLDTNASDLTAANFDVFAPTWIYGTPGDDELNGSDGSNLIRGEEGDDVISGLGGDDRLEGGAGSDYLDGGEGDDLLFGSSGDDTLDGGLGSDTASYAGSSAVFVNLGIAGPQDTRGAGVDTLIGIENLLGSGANDTLTGDAGANVIEGGRGDDTLDGGPGVDTVSYARAASGVTVDLSIDLPQNTGGAGTDTLGSFENALGSAFADILHGTDGANILSGGAGVDRLNGNAGNDTLDGGAGIDAMRGGAGDDTYYVDNISDKVIENAGEGTDTVYSSASFSLRSNVEHLILTGSAIRGNGNNLDNQITGTDGNNIFNGGLGADTMSGGLGNDTYYVDNIGDTLIETADGGRERVYTTINWTLGDHLEDLYARGSNPLALTGNALDNVLRGNSAANILDGGAGADDLKGGAGADRFVFDDGDFGGLTPSTCDRIIDFTRSDGDRIDLSAVDANSALSGDQAFTFIGTGGFTNVAGQLRYEQINGNAYVYGDVDGDGVADFMLRLDGTHSLVLGDFVI